MARQVQDRIGLRLEGDTAKSQPRSLNNREKKLAEAILYNTNIDDDFQQALVCSNTTQAGAAYTGATAEICGFHSGIAAYEVYQSAVAVAAIVMPFQSTSGLELKPVAAADKLELTCGTTATSRAAYTVGAVPGRKIFLEAKILIDDISDVTTLIVGWRKAEAYRADWNDYDEAAAFNIGTTADGQINISTILNNAATSTTDTTLTDWADAGEKTLRIEIDSDTREALFFVDGAVPTVTKSFKFDASEVIVPFIQLDTETGDPGVSLAYFRCGIV